MRIVPYDRMHLASIANFSDKDLNEINQCRQHYTQLGFGYQLVFVKIFNQFPIQNPLEIVDEVVTFVSLQLSIENHHIRGLMEEVPNYGISGYWFDIFSKNAVYQIKI